MSRHLFSLCLVVLIVPTAEAQEGPRDANAQVEEALAEFNWPGMIRLPIGVTDRGTIIWALMDEGALDYRSEKLRLLFIAGLNGEQDALKNLSRLIPPSDGDAVRDEVVAFVPLANPDAWVSHQQARSSKDDNHEMTFPPQGAAYSDGASSNAHCLWRFIGWFAPDLVTEHLSASDPVWWEVAKNGGTPDKWPSECLAAAVRRNAVAEIDRVISMRPPVVRRMRVLEPIKDHNLGAYSGWEDVVVMLAPDLGPPWSPLRKAVIARLDRSPEQVATELTDHYGDHLKTVMYQPALALVARLKLGQLTRDDSHLEEIEQLVAPYASGEQPTFPENPNGSQIAGHLVFAELAQITGKQEYIDLVLRAADFGFDDDGDPRESMPFHHEMSDAVFMGCPILTAAGRLTGKMKYFEMALRHLDFIRALCVREDGLYRHSPLCEAAWGRGNGFPMLGLALALTDLDATLADSDAHGLSGEQADRLTQIQAELLAAFRAHLAALIEHQDPTGTWHQVVDHPESYRELSSTCMITFAILRGLNQGWLDADEYHPVVAKAWEGIKVRVGPDGVLFDVCTGTGKQQTLRDYFDREAILGKDERGGAMALMASVEMAVWMVERQPANVE